MATAQEPELPEGKDLSQRWASMSRPVQGELWRKVRRGVVGDDRHEATMIAAMSKQRLRDFTMRPELILPAFIAVLWLLSLVLEGFSLTDALPAVFVYTAYMLWMRGAYRRAYLRNIAFLAEDAPAATPDGND